MAPRGGFWLGVANYLLGRVEGPRRPQRTARVASPVGGPMQPPDPCRTHPALTSGPDQHAPPSHIYRACRHGGRGADVPIAGHRGSDRNRGPLFGHLGRSHGHHDDLSRHPRWHGREREPDRHLQWSENESYSSEVTGDVTLPVAGGVPVPFARLISVTGLKPATLYHVRAIDGVWSGSIIILFGARSAGVVPRLSASPAVTNSQTMTFTTLATSVVPPGRPAGHRPQRLSQPVHRRR